MENSLGTVQELGARTKEFLREHALGGVPRDVCTLAFPGLDAKHLRNFFTAWGFSDFRNGDGYFTANEIADRLANRAIFSLDGVRRREIPRKRMTMPQSGQ
jgi:hypothetical protein